MQRSLSGIKPTGVLHLGNYFGAIQQFLEHQDSYDNYVFIANYHALTKEGIGADELREQSLSITKAYMACGLDPARTTLFLQSDVPLLCEMTWILNCLMTMPKLERAHAYKDALAKEITPSVGLFDYPILMASDILMWGSSVVPVGQDQKQHVEFARDLAEKFNRTYDSDLLIVPEPVILDSVAVVPGIDGQKMSKSYSNTIGLFDEYSVLKKSVMSIVTDSKGVEESKDPDSCNVFALHRLFATEDELSDLRDKYLAGGFGYGDSKKLLLERVEAFVAPIRERYNAISDDEVYAVWSASREKVAAESVLMMDKMRKLCGLSS